ncbi:hypothetical protein A9P98_08545 [Cylindrospermopsis raciborskii CS-505]|uniref:Uncharacterized protein n=1 Tax=Cylindrospermopsis raciborskii CS-505 TaxID=533240 RepID=A0A853MBM0_9CYAN|nr:hypothetical protein A9P98_08545 [Cylindrospermopsis raciborskii CS-505]
MVSGASLILLLPSTGYQNKSPATNTSGLDLNSISRFSLILTIHVNCTDFPFETHLRNRIYIYPVGLLGFVPQPNLRLPTTKLVGFKPT